MRCHPTNDLPTMCCLPKALETRGATVSLTDLDVRQNPMNEAAEAALSRAVLGCHSIKVCVAIPLMSSSYA